MSAWQEVADVARRYPLVWYVVCASFGLSVGEVLVAFGWSL